MRLAQKIVTLVTQEFTKFQTYMHFVVNDEDLFFYTQSTMTLYPGEESRLPVTKTRTTEAEVISFICSTAGGINQQRGQIKVTQTS